MTEMDVALYVKLRKDGAVLIALVLQFVEILLPLLSMRLVMMETLSQMMDAQIFVLLKKDGHAKKKPVLRFVEISLLKAKSNVMMETKKKMISVIILANRFLLKNKPRKIDQLLPLSKRLLLQQYQVFNWQTY